MHLFLAYVPMSFAASKGYNILDILIGGTISFVHVSLWAVTSGTTNDFFDRFEDRGYKENPFNGGENTRRGLELILVLTTLTICFTILVGLVIDIRIILFGLLAGLLSWWYSDNAYITRITGFRLKSHYLSELLALVFGYSLLFASSMAINRVLGFEAIPLLVVVALASARETIQKDRPQVEKDSIAGNRTVQVLYGLENADNMSSFLTYANYVALAGLSILGFLPLTAMLGLELIRKLGNLVRFSLSHV